MPLIPTFQLHLNDRIEERRACIGKYDGKHPSLTCATTGAKIFIHSPHVINESDMSLQNQMRYLNIAKQITAVGAASLKSEDGEDMLFVGTQSDLLAYNVEANSDVWFKEAADGVSTMTFGNVPSLPDPLALVGGNCSIQGFDQAGEELYWTVVGDNVSALAMVDTTGDGNEELVVGSDDFEIRVYQNEEILSEVTEVDRVLHLCAIHDSLYGYALANGTVGVYDKSSRVWRVKSKNKPTCIAGFDLDADGVNELVSGWTNGKLEVRGDRQGEVIFRDNLADSVSAVLQADYRSDGREEVIACGYDGEVRGYLPVDPSQKGASLMDTKAEEQEIALLTQRKQEMLFELQQYEQNNLHAARAKDRGDGEDTGAVVPTSTKVSTTLELDVQRGCCELVVATNNECVIRGVVVFAEQLFESESLFSYDLNPQKAARLPLLPPRDMAADMLIKALVGSRTSSVYHVFEMDFSLPKFAAYGPAPPGTARPESFVSFRINERVNRVAMWLQAAFVHQEAEGVDELAVRLLSLRTGKPLFIDATGDEGGTVTIRTDSMEVAGEVLQDLCAHLGISELEASAHFPDEMEEFRHVLLQVEEHNAVRLRLMAEMADSSNLVKTLVIKAEDARILSNMALTRKMYQQLYGINRDLIMEHTKRATNHTDLLAALKQVNQMIQRAAKLRVGSAKARVVATCRAAIKANNIQALFKIIESGEG